MITRYHHAYPLLRSAARVHDSEALQTDVMRFMAILGLCLTAIFALVQTLPSKPVQEQRQNAIEQTEQRERLEQALLQAQQRLADTRRQLAEQDRQRQQGSRQLQLLDARIKQQSLLLSGLRQEQAEQEQALAAADVQLRQSQALNRQLAVEQEQRTQALQTLGRELEQARKASKQLLFAADRRQLPTARPEQMRQIEEVPQPDPAPVEERGFLLRFASVEALDGLVRRGAVSVTGVVNSRAWRLSLQDDRALFIEHQAPVRMHEMTAQTVPARYLRAFKAAAGKAAVDEVIWGVMLPAEMERRIRALSRQSQGGTLVIQGDGEVRLKSGGEV